MMIPSTATFAKGLTFWRSPGASILVLAIFYAVGVVGVLLPLHKDFLLLTPFNLLLSLGLMLAHHPVWDRSSLQFLALAYVVGFAAECFGVQTGLLFGDYVYGPVLGPKLWETPLMIGVNWILVSYCAGVAINHLAGKLPLLLRAVLGALLMVGLDWFIEPVAMRHDFWNWAGDVVPLRNYLGWFGVSLPLQLFFARYLAEVRNKVALALLILQFLFFWILGIFSV